MIPHHLGRTFLGFVGMAALTATALAQYAYTGTDNFDDNSLPIGASQRWVSSSGTGTWTNTNQRLEFTTSPQGSSANRNLLVWYDSTTGNPSLSQDWNAAVFATIQISSDVVGTVRNGLEVFNVDSSTSYFGLYLEKAGSVYSVHATDGGSINWAVSVADSTDVLLRLTWSVATGTLTAGYSLDNGSTFVYDFSGSSVSYAPTSWSSGFGFRLASWAGADTVSAGTVYLDGMGVTAVPEPATCAMLVGIGALGLACWRRRRA